MGILRQICKSLFFRMVYELKINIAAITLIYSHYPFESIDKMAFLQSIRLERVRPKIRCPKLEIQPLMDKRQRSFPPSFESDG